MAWRTSGALSDRPASRQVAADLAVWWEQADGPRRLRIQAFRRVDDRAAVLRPSRRPWHPRGARSVSCAMPCWQGVTNGCSPSSGCRPIWSASVSSSQTLRSAPSHPPLAFVRLSRRSKIPGNGERSPGSVSVSFAHQRSTLRGVFEKNSPRADCKSGPGGVRTHDQRIMSPLL
jgi:hypothetical protein